jgi:hypothetical protein
VSLVPGRDPSLQSMNLLASLATLATIVHELRALTVLLTDLVRQVLSLEMPVPIGLESQAHSPEKQVLTGLGPLVPIDLLVRALISLVRTVSASLAVPVKTDLAVQVLIDLVVQVLIGLEAQLLTGLEMQAPMVLGHQVPIEKKIVKSLSRRAGTSRNNRWSGRTSLTNVTNWFADENESDQPVVGRECGALSELSAYILLTLRLDYNTLKIAP